MILGLYNDALSTERWSRNDELPSMNLCSLPNDLALGAG
jgi:hypothetical protein